MNPDIAAALIGAGAAIIGTLVSYISLRQKQRIENRALYSKLEQEHQLLKERLEKEQQLQFERFKKEQIETFRMDYYKNQLEAYQELWAILAPISHYSPGEDTILIKKANAQYLNCKILEEFFLEFRNFFYSQKGIFLSKELRQAIFEVRDFVVDIQKTNTVSSNGLIKISNNKAKRIENGMDWIRKNIRRDVGLEDSRLPTDQLLS